jgi:hypothetical protein
VDLAGVISLSGRVPSALKNYPYEFKHDVTVSRCTPCEFRP